MSKARGDKKRFDKVERITLWVGAICGIVVAGISIWEKVTAPSPPSLDVVFALTGTRSIAMVTPEDKETRLPLDLIVKNNGRLAARNVRLKLLDSKLHSGDTTDKPINTSRGYVTIDELLDAGLHPAYESELTIETNKDVYTQNSLYVGESVNTMTTVPVGEIHPGESVFLESILQARLYTNHMPVFLPSDREPSDLKYSTKHHRIVAWISAENFPEKEISLHLIVGQHSEIGEDDGPVFFVKGGQLVRSSK